MATSSAENTLGNTSYQVRAKLEAGKKLYYRQIDVSKMGSIGSTLYKDKV